MIIIVNRDTKRLVNLLAIMFIYKCKAEVYQNKINTIV